MCTWIRRFLTFYGDKKHPVELGAAEGERGLSHLAPHGRVAASIQRRALNAVVFLYRDVLDVDFGKMVPVRSKRHRKPPTVLMQAEVLHRSLPSEVPRSPSGDQRERVVESSFPRPSVSRGKGFLRRA